MKKLICLLVLVNVNIIFSQKYHIVKEVIDNNLYLLHTGEVVRMVNTYIPSVRDTNLQISELANKIKLFQEDLLLSDRVRIEYLNETDSKVRDVNLFRVSGWGESIYLEKLIENGYAAYISTIPIENYEDVFEDQKRARDEKLGIWRILDQAIAEMLRKELKREEVFTDKTKFYNNNSQQAIPPQPHQAPPAKKHNPDGERISVHIAPYLTGGDITIDQQIIAGSSFSNYSFNGEYETGYGLQILVKIPIFNSFTLSPFYSLQTFNNRSRSFYKYSNSTATSEEKVKDYRYNLGSVFSIYF